VYSNNKKTKKNVNTYSKKRNGGVINVNVQVNNIFINPTYNVINVFSSFNKSHSGDEFDKLLKVPSQQVPTSSETGTSGSREKYFWKRHDSAPFYNSDATIGSPSKGSLHLFSDICKDYSSDLFSTSHLPTPPSYHRTGKNKLVKLPSKHKTTNRVQKKKLARKCTTSNRPERLKKIISL